MDPQTSQDLTPDPRDAQRVLVIDDDPRVRQVVFDLLQITKRSALGAGTRSAALAIMASESIDSAIVDVNMPATDCQRLIAELRDFSPKLPIVVTSGFDIESIDFDIAEARCHFLAKPFRADRLLAALAEAKRIAPTA